MALPAETARRKWLRPWGGALLAACGTLPAHAETCFDAASNRSLQFEVFQQAPPPASAQARYDYYPLSAAASMDLARINAAAASGIGMYYFLWANRCQPADRGGGCGWARKGNVVFPPLRGPGGETRTYFSGHEQADACTLAQATRALGASEAEAVAEAAKSQVRAYANGPGVPALRRGERLVDVCPLPVQPLRSDAAGIVLDYEVADDRSPAHTLAFLRRFAALVHAHGRQAILFIDPWDAPSAPHSGIDATNAASLYALFDRSALFLWHRNRQNDVKASAAAQLSLLGFSRDAPAKRLLAVFELGQTSLADARAVREFILARSLAGVMFWRNGAGQGGSCATDVNRKIACVAFGRCD
ncbi:MAG: hypothetical protein ISP90_03490 [Nevskia sp.]|nr:hypothetical protein [Nevskia sp.]